MAMDVDRILGVVTCVTSVLTFFAVGVTVLPHMKEGMAIVRDAVLWLAFLAVLTAVIGLGVQRLRAEGMPPVLPRLSSLVKSAPAPEPAPEPQVAANAPVAGDPYYKPPAD